jgi:hypothetical protein
MSRYRVNLGKWDYDLIATLDGAPSQEAMSPDEVDLQVLFNWVNKEMRSLANTATPGLLGDCWSFKTESLAEAEEIHWKARRIVELALPGREEMYLDISIVEDEEGATMFVAKKLKVRCPRTNQRGNQCGNLIWHDQVACYVHRQIMTVEIPHSPDQVISSDA